jgi:hypothetical protein
MYRFAWGVETEGVSHAGIVSADSNPWVFFLESISGHYLSGWPDHAGCCTEKKKRYL